MQLPQIQTIIELLDNNNESIVGGNEIKLTNKYGLRNLIPLYVEAFYKIKNWPGRMHISFNLVRYAPLYPEIIELAIHGLNDRSKIVRNYCCRILAYAGNDKSLPYLEALKSHKSLETREDAIAAIDAIVNKNHNLWVDREHKGNIFWKVEEIA